jgi:hypothetical protein
MVPVGVGILIGVVSLGVARAPESVLRMKNRAFRRSSTLTGC